MPLKLRPVRMKNSLYLLVPKGIGQLLEIDESRECVLTAQSADGSPVLRYSFTVREAGRERTVAQLRKNSPKKTGSRQIIAT